MGGCSGLPGVFMITAATVLLILVSFNTPMLKSIYFFRATFQDYDLRLGTLGYCKIQNGAQECVGPQVGYNLDLNKILNLDKDKLFNIPAAISKWMTYTLVLHIVALGFGGVGVLVGLLDLIPGFNMICFPTCMAGICGSITLIALIFDLVLFYIFKASVGRVSGATGEIGAAVWMVLAAWLLACFAGCAYGLGRCCCNCGGNGSRRERKRERERDRELESYRRRDEDMRLDAIRDEHRRKLDQEQGLPAFPEVERMPLNGGNRQEDKYLYDDGADDIPQVGAGYGRRDNHHTNSNLYQYDYNYGIGTANQVPYDPSVTTAGAAGIGAGPGGVASTGNAYNGGGYDYGNSHGGYNDPYQQQQHNYDPYYSQQQHNNVPTTYPPNATTSPTPAHAFAGAAAGAAVGAAAAQGYNHYNNNQNTPYDNTQNTQYNTQNTQYNNQNTQYNNHPDYLNASNHTAYPEPEPQVQHNPTYQPYGHDDGLGAIGRAITSPTEAKYPANATSPTYVSSDSHYSRARTMSPPQPLQPIPQHLRGQHQSELLTSPVSEYPSESATTGTKTPDPFRTSRTEDAFRSEDAAPPSYGAVASGQMYQPMEKGRPVNP